MSRLTFVWDHRSLLGAVCALIALLRGTWLDAAGGDPSTATKFIPPDGCVVEPVAGPPLVRYPLFGCFDDQGRLYVAEGTGLNAPGEELVEKKLGRITLLEDTDGDGRFDKSTIFADQLVFPQGVLWHDGAVYTASHPNIWKLQDTDGDGRADRREVLVGTFGFNGNGCDIHGPFLGIDGWLYWTHGRHGYDILCPDGRRLKGQAASIFRCRTDGTQVEPIAGGAFDNPVELIFTPEGEILGTMDQGPGDRLLHYIEGGVYPRMDHPSVNELIQTGPPLGSVSEFAAALPVALCGLERLRSYHFGASMQGRLLSAQFNVHRIQQHVLRPDGATYRADDFDWLISFDHDVRLSDVFEDADGSVLVIDMGAWFNYGCPTAKIAKPEVLGAIYRIRRDDAPRPQDPWGKQIDWPKLSPQEVVQLLADPRFKVQDKAVARLATFGSAAVPFLATATCSASLEVRRNAIWALTRIDDPQARAAVRAMLTSEDTALRHAALHSVSMWRDAEALPLLEKLVIEEQPALRRKAAEALGRIRDARSVPALFESLRKGVSDRFLEHAIIYALIHIGDCQATRDALRDPNPHVRRAALIALDQIDGGHLSREQVLPLLDTDDPELQQAVFEVISRREGWVDAIQGLARDWLRNSGLSDEQQQSLVGVLIAYSTQPEIQQLIAEALGDSATPYPTRLLLLEVMARSRVTDFPAAWQAAIRRALSEPNDRLVDEAVAAIRWRRLTIADEALLALSRDQGRPMALRIAAL